MSELSTFLTLLEDLGNKGNFRFSWEQNLGENFSQIQKIFLTKVTPNSEDQFEFSCQASEESLQKRFGNSPGGGNWHDDMKKQFFRPAWDTLEWEWANLGARVARAFDLNSKPAETGTSLTRQIAELHDMPILLTIQPDEEKLLAAAAHITLSLNEPFILLAPTRRYYNVKTRELLSRTNSGFFDLDSTLVLKPSGLLLACKTGMQLFSKFLKEQNDNLDDNTAKQLFELVAKLDSGSKIKKAPLQHVFNLFVREGLSQAEIAKKCKCSEATISNRIKALEKNLKISIQNLRIRAAAFPDFNNLEKDTRARSLNRSKLVDDTGLGRSF